MYLPTSNHSCIISRSNLLNIVSGQHFNNISINLQVVCVLSEFKKAQKKKDRTKKALKMLKNIDASSSSSKYIKQVKTISRLLHVATAISISNLMNVFFFTGKANSIGEGKGYYNRKERTRRISFHRERFQPNLSLDHVFTFFITYVLRQIYFIFITLISFDILPFKQFI